MLLKITSFWFPVLIYSGIIFALSAQPNLSVPGGFEYSDKIMHLLEYAPFGFLIARALNKTNIRCAGMILLILATVLSFFYGLSDEYHQSFVSGRQSSLLDALADLIGGMLGGLIFIRTNHRTTDSGHRSGDPSVKRKK